MAISTTDVLTTDTLDQGRVKVNANDEALASGLNGLQGQQTTHLAQGHPSIYYPMSTIDSQQATQDAALATHKTSGDHDSRYLSMSYLATMARTAFNQTIDGIKNFLQNVLISNGAPTLELHDVSGNILARLYAVMGSPNIVRLSIAESSAWKEVMEAIAGQSFVNFPNHDVASKGNLLATQAYVEDYVQEHPPANSNSVFVIERSVGLDELYASLPFSLTIMQPTMVPAGAVLEQVRYGHVGEDGCIDTKSVQCSIQFNDTGKSMVKVIFGIDAQQNINVSVWAAQCIINGNTNDVVTWTSLVNFVITEGASSFYVSSAPCSIGVTLLFGMAV